MKKHYSVLTKKINKKRMAQNKFFELCFQTNCREYNPKAANFKENSMYSIGKDQTSKEGTGSKLPNIR
jgi:hypothetical protein